MLLMPSRHQALQQALAGLERTGTPLIGWNGEQLFAVGYTDDLGLYHAVPLLARWFHLSLDQAVSAFFGGVALFTLLLGGLGFYLMFSRPGHRFAAWLGLAVTSALAFTIGDVYLLQWATVFSVIPLCWGLVVRRCFTALAVIAPLIGLWLGFANQIRSHAGTTVLVFLAIALMRAVRVAPRKKALLAVLCLSGLGLNALYFNQLCDRRDALLPGQSIGRTHPVWHSIYIGLGFVDNPFGIRYDDQVAARAVHSIDPDAGYCSPAYEAILKSESLRILIHHPLFAFTALGAKAGVVLAFGLLFGGPGLLLRRRCRRLDRVEQAFAASLAFAALPGLLVVPYHNYLLGFISLASLYSLSVCAES